MNGPGWRRFLRRLILTAMVGTSFAFAGLYLKQSSTGPPPLYRWEAISRGPVVESVSAGGQLAPRISVDLGSQTSGNVSRVLVDFGSKVSANQLLAELDRSTYEVSLKQARIGLAVAKAAREQASRHASQLEQLQGQGLVSKDDYEKAKADLVQADGAVKLAAALVSRSQIDLDRCQIRSPIDGEVVARNVSVGQTVAASLSAPVLFVIADDLGRMQIQANVPEADAGRVAPDQEAQFTVDAYPDEVFEGRVIAVRSNATIDQNVVTYPAIILVDNPGRKLKPGMTATVSIVLARRDEALRVPDAALRFRPPGAARDGGARSDGSSSAPAGAARDGDRPRSQALVYVATARRPPGEDETALVPTPVRIRIGLDDGRYTEVLEGLEEGARVVTGVAQRPGGSRDGDLLSRLSAVLRGGASGGKHGRAR